MIGLIAFAAGAIIGSFLNVCIYRLPREESIVSPARSYCPNCRTTIAWYDNVPILSYCVLRGRCRSCGWHIPCRYLVVELLAAFLTAFTVVHFSEGGWIDAIIYVVLVNALIAISFIDLDHLIIPDEISIPGIFVGVAVCVLIPGFRQESIFGLGGRVGALVSSLFGALIGGGLIYLVAVIGKMVLKKDAMGMGDVKLMAMVGAFIGWRLVVLSIFFGSFFGSIVGVILIASQKAEMQTKLPFGPFLALGAVVSLFYGDALIAWYVGLL